MRTKIAPTLREFADPKRKYLIEHKRERAAAELRALLAVARAAEHLVNEDRNRKPGTIHCTWIEACDRTSRALSRLARASGAKGGRK